MKIIRVIGRKEAGAFNKEFKQHHNKKCFILHFYMKGCIHCENLEPEMKALETHMNNHSKYNNITLGKIDAQHMDDVAVDNVHEFPTLKVMRLGQTHQYKGAPQEKEILSWIDRLLEENNTHRTNTIDSETNNSNNSVHSNNILSSIGIDLPQYISRHGKRKTVNKSRGSGVKSQTHKRQSMRRKRKSTHHKIKGKRRKGKQTQRKRKTGQRKQK